MSENFHEWLSNCPVEWWRISVEKQDGKATHTIYGFPVDDEEE